MKYLLPFLLLALTGCKAQQFTQAGAAQGVQVSYRWKHAPGKPSELLLKMVNSSDSARSVHVGLDLYDQGRTVEQFTADTCMRARRTMNGRLNGFYFIPTTVTPEQAAGPDVKVELTELEVTPVVQCP
ncbi:MAG: hypothetical protein IPN44_09335 [Flavobacteriales bacterium]|nr:hypothetical protein [Flavobacteriales bacterium]